MERRIAAVLAADMVGYSRLVERDEVGTLKRQKRHFRELIEPSITNKNGRIVKLTGDGLIAEFSSVVEAVQCAVSVQAEMAAREKEFPDDEKIIYRIAIHLGDLVFDDGDVYGDGVNVAARLEGLAEPGGVVVSGTAYDVLKANVDVAYKSLGEQQLKNIATPVRVYQVVEGVAVAPVSRSMRRAPRIAVAVVVLAMLGGLLWWLQKPDFEPLNPEELAFALPDKPSLAVLPFENLSDRADDQYMADGFVDTLITELMSLQDLVVIAKNSSFSFRGQQVLNSTIAEQLGVRYLLEGSFQHQGDTLRINARLMDAVEGKQVWSKRYDREANEFIALQDDLIKDLVLEIGGRAGGGVFKAERERVGQIPNDELRAYELWEKATRAFLKLSPDGNEETRILSEELITRFPDHPRGYISLAWHHLGKAWAGVPHEMLEVAEQCTELAEHAISLAPNDYMAYMIRAYCSSRAGEAEAAKTWAQRAYDLNQNDIFVQRDYARYVLVHEGKYEQAAEIYERNLRLNPAQQNTLNAVLGELYLIMERYDEAIEQLQKEAVQSAPTKARTAAALYLSGRTKAAEKVIEALRASAPEFTVETFVRSLSWIPADAIERIARALKASGLPEITPADPEEFAFALPEKPSIIVLPFDNLSGDASLDYLGDGLSEAIIAALGHHPKLFVIARNSSFTYKGKATKVQTIAEEMGVRYVLEGSFQVEDDELRVTAQLIDAIEGNNLWSDVYGHNLSTEGLFEIYDGILEKVVVALDQKLISITAQDGFRDAGDLQTYDLIGKAIAEFQKFTPESNHEAEIRALAALERNPDSVGARTILAWVSWFNVLLGIDPVEQMELARQYSEEVLKREPQSSGAYSVLAWLDLFAQDYDAAIAHADKSLELNPAGGGTAFLAGWVYSASGNPKRGAELLQLGMRTEPFYPIWVPSTLARSYMMLGQFEEAEELLQAVYKEDQNPAYANALAVTLVRLGKLDEAKEIVRKVLKAYPTSVATDHLRFFGYIRDKDYLDMYTEALVAAGMPASLPAEPKETRDLQPDNPTIVVLPFANLSADPDQEYFADGMTDDLIVRLANVDGVFVISRNTAFTYKGKSVTAKELRRDLNVRYVVEGSVRRVGNRVRINAQLIDARSESSVWAKMFDQKTAKLFETQDEVTTEIAEALKLKLDASDLSATAAEGPKNLEAYDLYLKGMSELRQRRPEAFARAKIFLDDALEIDPDYADAHAALAFLYWESQQHGWLSHLGIENTTEAFVLVEQHLESTRDSPTPVAHLVRSEWLSDMKRDSEGAISEARLAVKLDPSFADAYVGLAGRLALAGQTEEALRMTEAALRLDPVTPPDYHLTVGLAHIIDGDYEEAVIPLEVAVKDGSSKNFPWVLLTAAYGHLGRLEDAERALAAIERNNKRSGLPPFFANYVFQWSIHDLAVRERIFEDLKNAGARHREAMLVGGQAKRQLSGEEIQDLVISTTGKGVMVDSVGNQNDFAWTVDPDARMNFHLFGQAFETHLAFFDDRACNERGCSYYFELTDSEAVKWGHRYVIEEQTGLLFYFTTKPLTEFQE
ncbi:tetratricopeptide repeat protein [Seohaeicola saemankumensis]|nr:tetratricopeptide repeat protein [Seohaeicola saemankumensis]MCA0873905.1 tetratricopeptide repeat protein [Seohaeicola saemankumensis]